MRFAWLLLLLATGCLYVGWDDVPNAKVRPEVHAIYLANTTYDNQAYWSAEVANAVAIWNEVAVAADCTAPFEISDDGDAHPIRLLPRGAWPYADNVVGMYLDEYEDDLGSIVIRERRPDRSHVPVLLHELGHAIGLTHDESPHTIMNARTGSITQPTARDIARMRDALGC